MNTPGNNLSNATLEQRARALYHEAARNLDPGLAGRLRAARREALAGTRQVHHHVARWLVPSGACAAIALAALLAWPSEPRPAAEMPATAVTATVGNEADSPLPPDPEQADPNLYQNLDFYGWLAANDNPPPAH
ncbi:hypothetical protein [Rhodanobacter sp. DHB23]|uniref:hypothetical protein n=1 Tax=Rhodanobacter sp. DHB23 TaxID=2775923 RepID=UPI001784760A|nr:hypothetical protein [Rhodanobacter sp. DHB23]MBD8872309.1 hypothetical protein [Rhodanobacter sp. DHB23]